MAQLRAPERRVELRWFAAAVAVSLLLVLVSAGTGVPSGPRQLGAYLDATVEANLPTWWSTALFTGASLAHAVAALAARAAGAAGAGYWVVGASVMAGLSLAEHTSLHDRVAAAASLPSGPMYLLAGAAAVTALGLVALGLGGRTGLLIAAGAVVTVTSAVSGEIAARTLLAGGAAPGSTEHVLITHVAEFGENVGALLLIAAATSALSVTRVGAAVSVRYRRGPHSSGPARPMRRRGAWFALVAACAGLSVASLTVVQLAPLLEPGLRDLRPYLDVLAEDNLPTWWSSALLLIAAAAHALVGAAGRSGQVPGATAWLVSAAVLAALSLDDHTSLHERSEVVGRWLVDSGSYPFLWLIPGAAAGAVVAAAVVVLAARSPGRPRWLLVTGMGVLLGCALGLEAVQGLFMQAADEGLAFAVTYHVEELGENLAALLLLGAAASAVTITAADGRVVTQLIRYSRHRLIRR